MSDAHVPEQNPTEYEIARAAAMRRGTEHHWTESALLPSWAEHRRRRLIERTVLACDAFGVDVLVLHEYSVRPDTVAWLKDLLLSLPGNLSIVAGTYRLHGNRTDLYFLKQYADIFGLVDRQRVLESSGQSADKAAFLTLLHPVDKPLSNRVITVFTRRKKYPSVAMGEIFNPPLDEWAPLLTIDRLTAYLADHLKRNGLASLDEDQVKALARAFPAAERQAELICSELFVTTNPVNWRHIEEEFRKLCVRFGHTISEGDNFLAKDVNSFANFLGARHGKGDGRTIIVVPAYTTRSADYWIFGQSALLAAGLTTVFCAAVSQLSKGGSCFIGKNSWVDEESVPGLLLPNTPYSSWSRGIYYGRRSDALGAKEQAVVIADVDPKYMNEGRPRPQSLPVPMQLVAHLPIAEVVDYAALQKGRVPTRGV